MSLCLICAISASALVPLAPGSEEQQNPGPTGGTRPITDPLPAPGVWTHLGRTADRRPIVLESDPGPESLSEIDWIASLDMLEREMEFAGPGGIVIDKKRVYASAWIDNVYHAIGVDRESGEVLWTTPLPPPVFNSWATPTIDMENGTVLYAAFDSLIALTSLTGAMAWSASAESLLVNASPAVTTDLGPADRAFITNFGVVSPPGRLLCVNVDPFDATLNPYEPGDVVWSATLSSPTSGATPAYRDSMVYVGTAGFLDLSAGTIEAFDATSTSTPSPVWSTSVPGEETQGFYGGLTLATGFVFGATFNFYGGQLSSLLVKVDAQTGELIWTAACNRTSSIPIAVGDGRIALSGGLLPTDTSDSGSRPSVELFHDHGQFGELLWDSAIDTWDDENENGVIDDGEYLAIGGWSHHPAMRVEPGVRQLYVGTVSSDDVSGVSFNPYDEMRLIDLNEQPDSTEFVVDSATGYGSSPAIVGGALFSIGPPGLTRVSAPGPALSEDPPGPVDALEAFIGRYDSGFSGGGEVSE